MKSWFKYEYGYININKSNIYFTNTGNGSELRRLKEVPFGKDISNTRDPFAFLGVISVPIYYYIIDLEFTLKSVLIVSGIFTAVYFAFQYLKRERGVSLWIPMDSLENIQIELDFVEVSYLNVHGNIKSIELDKVEKDGIKFWAQLKERLNLETH
ncbi:MAG: hypothetical protein AAFR87_25985 [Bacteroidota bacterium]